MKAFASNLRQARIAAGLTQEQAARQLDVTMMTWARWEQGQRTPLLATLQRIADLLQTTPSDLLREEQPK